MARAAEIVAFDVETTGLSPYRGHRVIEIGAVYRRTASIIEFSLFPVSPLAQKGRSPELRI
jgi:DNA polymerase III epsilon subunit-like protein